MTSYADAVRRSRREIHSLRHLLVAIAFLVSLLAPIYLLPVVVSAGRTLRESFSPFARQSSGSRV